MRSHAAASCAGSSTPCRMTKPAVTKAWICSVVSRRSHLVRRSDEAGRWPRDCVRRACEGGCVDLCLLGCYEGYYNQQKKANKKKGGKGGKMAS
jgi:hypothetical protein